MDQKDWINAVWKYGTSAQRRKIDDYLSGDIETKAVRYKLLYQSMGPMFNHFVLPNGMRCVAFDKYIQDGRILNFKMGLYVVLFILGLLHELQQSIGIPPTVAFLITGAVIAFAAALTDFYMAKYSDGFAIGGCKWRVANWLGYVPTYVFVDKFDTTITAIYEARVRCCI